MREDTNVLDYWRKVESVDLDMASVAAVVLVVPETQVTVERGFSHLPLVLSDRRRSGKNTMAELLLLKLDSIYNYLPLFSLNKMICRKRKWRDTVSGITGE